MAPDSINIRIQSLMRAHFSPQQRSHKHPFIQHFTATRVNTGRSVKVDGDVKETDHFTQKKSNRLVKGKRRKLRASQYSFQDLGRLAKNMLTMTSPLKESTSTSNNQFSHTTIKNPISYPASPDAVTMAPYFELPQLTLINFSLTEGTDIPPPMESPTHELAPAWPDSSQFEPQIKQNFTLTPAPTPPITPNQTPEDDDDDEDGDEKSFQKISPYHISTKQPSSIRRFFSRRKLNSIYTNDSTETIEFSRPSSSVSFVSSNPNTSPVRKRHLSWLGRFNGNHKKRASAMIEVNQDLQLDLSPPPPRLHPSPPTLPQLSQLQTNVPDLHESLGGLELFKDVK